MRDTSYFQSHLNGHRSHLRNVTARLQRLEANQRESKRVLRLLYQHQSVFGKAEVTVWLPGVGDVYSPMVPQYIKSVCQRIIDGCRMIKDIQAYRAQIKRQIELCLNFMWGMNPLPKNGTTGEVLE